MRIVWWLLAVALVVYAGVCAALFVFQRSLIYFPQPSASADESTTFALSVPDARLLVSFREHAGPKALIYFGGNAEDVSQSLPSLAQAFPDRAIYLLHYRGYGGSSGSPSEEALQQDAQALFDKVHVAHADIAIVGRSLGSGVAVRLASQRPASRLVLVTPYDSIQELAAAQFPYVPVRWLLTDKFESSRYAPLIRVPTQLVAAEFDEVIPRQRTERLHASFARGVASLAIVAGTGHNTISGSPQYLEVLRQALP
jgi:pimeloyl-ACP methyl ester carboxylesterase